MKSCRQQAMVCNRLTFKFLPIIFGSLFSHCSSLFLSGSDSSYLRYPQLNFCENSSISLEFKTTASSEALLLYADELSKDHQDPKILSSQRTAFLEISYDTSGHVTALVREDTRSKLRIGPYSLNDGRWHKVEVKKIHGKLQLALDKRVTKAAYSFGGSDVKDYYDDKPRPDAEYVYVGGIPAVFHQDPKRLSLPSAALRRTFNGYIRNVIYRNCTCQAARVRHLSGIGFQDFPPSKCDDGTRRCLKGCTCYVIDNDDNFRCDCTEKHCVESFVTHYSLSFDRTNTSGQHGILFNESDVSAILVTKNFDSHKSEDYEHFFLKDGVKQEAILLNDSTGHVQISGSDHSSECFGDLSLCGKGYTLMAWLKMLDDSQSSIEQLVMASSSYFYSNVQRRLGLHVTWNPSNSQLTVTVSTTSGHRNHVMSNRMTSSTWHHVAVTWHSGSGCLKLYVDGTLASETISGPVIKPANQSERGILNDTSPSFFIGQPQVLNGTNNENGCRSGFMVDELNYWSKEFSHLEILENGPMFCRDLPLDTLGIGSNYLANFSGPRVHGQPSKVEGKINGALMFKLPTDKLEYYIKKHDSGLENEDSSNMNLTSCFSNMYKCFHGLTVSLWLRSGTENSSSSLSSSSSREIFNVGGLGLVVRKGLMIARVSSKEMELSQKFLQGVWYFIEVTWSQGKLLVYINGRMASFDVREAKNNLESAITFGEWKDNEEQRDVSSDSKSLGNASSITFENMDSRSAPKDLHKTDQPIPLALDEIQLCYGSRERLLALGIIQRGTPDKILLELDKINERGRLNTSDGRFVASVSKDAITVPGKVNSALRLDGNQYVQIQSVSSDMATSCLLDLARCRHGFYLSVWVKFREVGTHKTVLVWSRNVLVEYFKDNKSENAVAEGTRSTKGSLLIQVSLRESKWTCVVKNVKVDAWTFVEISWSRNYIVEVYIDKHKKEVLMEVNEVKEIDDVVGFYFGKKGHEVTSGKMLLDEIELWFQDRATLLAFDHINRGNITHVFVSLEQNDSSKMNSTDQIRSLGSNVALVPTLDGVAEIVKIEDRIGYVLNLCTAKKRGYATLGSRNDTCLGNLEFCSHGLTVTLLIKLRRPLKRCYIVATAGYTIELLADGKLQATLESKGTKWNVVTTSAFLMDKWYRVSITWEKEKGLSVYLDKERKAHDADGKTDEEEHGMKKNGTDYTVYLGKSGKESDDDEEGSYPSVTLNQIEFWFASRNLVLAFGSFDDDVAGLRLDMEKIENDILVHRSHVAYVIGSPKLVKGFRGQGIFFNGLSQYIDLGRDVICKSRLDLCAKGITVRFKIRPLELLDLTYFVSSPLVDVFYARNFFICVVRNQTKQWTLYARGLVVSEWNEIDITWTAEKGATLYVNAVEAGHEASPTTNEEDFDSYKKFFIGRSSTDMSYERYAHAIFDDVEFWESDLETLKRFGHLDVDDGGSEDGGGSDDDDGNEDYDEKSKKKPKKPRKHRTKLESSNDSGKRRSGHRHHHKNKNIDVPVFKPFHRRMLTFDGHSFVLFETEKFIIEDLIQLQEGRTRGPEHNYHTEPTFQLSSDTSNVRKQTQKSPEATEQLLVKFKTNDADGMLFHAGDKFENIYLSLKRGHPVFVVNYNANETEKFKPTLGAERLDDGNWHEILLTRQHSGITITVDGMDHPRTLSYEIGFLRKGNFWVGGHFEVRNLTNNQMRNNFRGSIDRMTFTNGRLPNGVNLIDIVFVKPTRSYLQIHGNVIGEPSSDHSSAEKKIVTFQGDTSAFIRLPRWRVEPIKLDEKSDYEVKLYKPNQTAGITPRHRPFLELNFKTYKTDCFLLYAGGKPGYTDFLVIEISEGYLWTVYDAGSGAVERHLIGGDRGRLVNDGADHFVKIEVIGQNLNLTLDKAHRSYSVTPGNPFSHMGTFTYVGGVDNLHRLPWHVWNREHKSRFFVGCVWNVRFTGGTSRAQRNQKKSANDLKKHPPKKQEYFYDDYSDYELIIDLPNMAADQGSYEILKGCKSKPPECDHKPCGIGKCENKWNGYVCDCSGTKFNGPACNLESTRMGFAGENHLHLRFNSLHSRHRNDISLRFKTLETRGLLFKTRAKSCKDSIEAFLDDGEVNIGVKFGEQMEMKQMVCKCNESIIKLNDNTWHTINIVRKAAHLSTWVDGCTRNSVDIIGEGFTFEIDEISIGGIKWNKQKEERYHVDNNDVQDDDNRDYRRHVCFIGYMRNFIFDKFQLLENLTDSSRPLSNFTESFEGADANNTESAKSAIHWLVARNSSDPSGLRPSRLVGFSVVANTATVASDERLVPSRPITIKNTFLVISASGNSPMYVTFLFRFVSENARQMLLFRCDRREEKKTFLSLEILESSIRLAGDNGDGMKELIIPQKLRPKEWHTLRLRQSVSMNEFYLEIDYDDHFHNNDIPPHIVENSPRKYSLIFPRHRNFSFVGGIYLGGANETLDDLYEEGHLKARDKFQGCLASLYVNDQPTDLQAEASRMQIGDQSYLEKRCSDEFMSHCRPDTCKNGGKCIELRKKPFCECQLTAHDGSFCEKEAKGFQFGSTGINGLTQIEIAEPIDTSEDIIAFAFMTWQKNSTLIRMDSQSSSDYLETRLLNGQLTVLGSLGGEDYNMSTSYDEEETVDDGTLHVVNILRNGNALELYVNATLVAKHKGDDVKKEFKNLIDVKLGGDVDQDENVVNAFRGILAGLYINGMLPINTFIANAPTNIAVKIANRGDVVVAAYPFHVERTEKTSINNDADKERTELQHPHQHNITEPYKEVETSGDNATDSTSTSKDGSKKREVSEKYGGGGAGWIPYKSVTGMLEGIGIYMLPGGLSGAGINTRLQKILDEAGSALSEHQQQRPRRVVKGGIVIEIDTEGPRAIAVVGTLLAIMLTASSAIWALYKFKPGRLFKKKVKLAKFSSALASGESPSSSQLERRSYITDSSPYMQSRKNNLSELGDTRSRRGEIALIDANNKITQTYLKGLCTEDVPLGTGFTLSTSSPLALITPRLSLASESPRTPLSGMLSPSYYQHSPNSGSAFVPVGATVSGTTIAGMIATREKVSRPTQTELTFIGLAKQKPTKITNGFKTNYSNTPADDKNENIQVSVNDENDKNIEHIKNNYDKSQQSINKGELSVGGFKRTIINQPPKPTIPAIFFNSSSFPFKFKTNLRHIKTTTPSNTPTDSTTMSSTAVEPTPQSCLPKPQLPSLSTSTVAPSLRKISAKPSRPNWSTRFSSETSSVDNDSSIPYDVTSSTSSLASEWSQCSGRPGMLAGEMVECLVLDMHGDLLVTGSYLETPVVWDAHTASQMRTMHGENSHAVDLYLVSQDSLLVGGVPLNNMLELTDDEEEAVNMVAKTLQIWDFASGFPMEMPPYISPYEASHLIDSNDQQSTEFLMASYEVEPFQGVLFTVYDLLGNEVSFQHQVALLNPNDPFQNDPLFVSRLLVSGDRKYASAILVNASDLIRNKGGRTRSGQHQYQDLAINCTIVNCCIDNDSIAAKPAEESSTVAFKASPKATSPLATSHLALTVTGQSETVVWNMATGSVVQRSELKWHIESVRDQLNVCYVEISMMTDNLIALGTSDGWIGKFDLKNETIEKDVKSHKDKITVLKFTNSDQLLVSSSKDGKIKIWVSVNLDPITTLEVGSPVLDLRISQDSKVMAALSREVKDRRSWKRILKRNGKQKLAKKFSLFRVNQN